MVDLVTEAADRLRECPLNPQKVKFFDRAGAQAHIDRTGMPMALGGREKPPPRVPYQCPGCGWWHVATDKRAERRGRA